MRAYSPEKYYVSYSKCDGRAAYQLGQKRAKTHVEYPKLPREGNKAKKAGDRSPKESRVGDNDKRYNNSGEYCADGVAIAKEAASIVCRNVNIYIREC